MNKPTLKDRVLNFYRTRPLIVFGVLVCLAGVGAIIGMIVLVSIFQHKQEARNPFFKVVELTEETETRPSGVKTFRSNTTTTSAQWINSARATAGVKPSRARRHKPTRARSSRSRASRKIRV